MLPPAAGSSDCSDLPLEHMCVSESKYVRRVGSAPNHFHGKGKSGKEGPLRKAHLDFARVNSTEMAPMVYNLGKVCLPAGSYHRQL